MMKRWVKEQRDARVDKSVKGRRVGDKDHNTERK